MSFPPIADIRLPLHATVMTPLSVILWWSIAVSSLGLGADAAANEVPVSYIVSVVAYKGECHFLPTDVGLTRQQLTTALKDYNRDNGIVLVFYEGVPHKCVKAGYRAARAAGFSRVSSRKAETEDLGIGRVP